MRAVIAGTVLVLSTAAAWAAPVTWELRGNRWEQVSQGPATQPASEPLLDRAESIIAHGNGKSGAKLALEWLKDKPRTTPQRDRALMLVAEGLFRDDKRMDAFYYLDELMDEHPESTFYQQALAKQYDIADDYLKGHRRVFLFLPIIDAED